MKEEKKKGEIACCISRAVSAHLCALKAEDLGTVYASVIGQVERPLLQTMLDMTQGNLTRTAEMLGLNRNTLRKKMREYGVGR